MPDNATEFATFNPSNNAAKSPANSLSKQIAKLATVDSAFSISV
jgi:hypothetical protein